MKLLFKYTVFCCLLFVHQKINSQVSIDSVSNPFELEKFTLVYGNANFDIYDFAIVNKYKVLLLTKSDGALFVLLNKNNLVINTLFFKSAPANIKFWYNKNTFFYQSIFFYKSNLCNLDYKPGIASFYINNDSLKFKACFPIEDSYIRKELFQATNNFKVTLLEKEKRKKKKRKEDDEFGEINNTGFAVNGNYIVKRKIPNLRSSFQTYFPFAEMNNHLYVFDIFENVLYNFENEEDFFKTNLCNNVQYKDTSNSYVSYELLPDNGTNELYLLTSQRVVAKRKGREKQHFKESQYLYKLFDNKWKLVDYKIPHFSHKMKVDYKKIYTVFDVKDERGISKKVLYISNKHLF